MLATNLDLKRYYLQQLGIDCWVKRTPNVEQSLQKLAREVSACTRCDLHKTRTNTVFFRGNTQAKLLIIGDTPDETSGTAFVGEAGTLLDNLLAGVGLRCQDVYITNALKCRALNPFDTPDEAINTCRTFLTEQIRLINPEIIIVLGPLAAQAVLHESSSFDTLRLREHEYDGKPVIVTFHPAQLLRFPKQKKQAYQDWLVIKALYAHEKVQ